MTRILKTLGLALVAVTALSAVMAAGASAQLAGTGLTAFNTTTKTHESATLSFTALKTGVARLTAGAAVATCEEETFSGKTSGTEETPSGSGYVSNCHMIIGGSTISTEVDLNGCGLQFHLDKEVNSTTFEGHASIKGCTNEDKSITKTASTGCVVHVREADNQNINGGTVHNVAGSPSQLKVTIASTNIHSQVTGGLLTCGVAAGTHATGTLTAEYTVSAKNTAGQPIDLTVQKLAT